MFVSRVFQPRSGRRFYWSATSLLVTASFAQNAAPQSAQPSMPPLTPMPQAPAPQNNAHLYSDGRLEAAISIPQCPGSLQSAKRAACEPDQFCAHRPTVPRWQDISVDQRRGSDGVGKQLGCRPSTLQSFDRRYGFVAHEIRIVRPGRSSGSIQGTPGGPSAGGTGSASTGATGTGAGGTQIGVGGAGAGAGGQVGSTLRAGPPLSSYDPVLTGTIQGERAATPESNVFFSGVPSGAKYKYL